MQNPLERLDAGAPAGVDSSPTLHANFPQIIEQNFARLNGVQAAQLLDRLSEAELSDLAQLYINASADTGRQARLLQVLATRQDAKRLGRVSRHFGFGPTYEAITSLSPAKSQEFS